MCFVPKESYSLEDLSALIAYLRSPTGCPWDREQTHESIRRNFLEETYEACEAIDRADPDLLREELGDVLTQVIFHARIEEEAGRFNLADIADATCKKLVSRHPHLFNGQIATTADAVMDRWEEIKQAEKRLNSTAESMDSVARSLPSAWRAEKVQSKAEKAGFDWDSVDGIFNKLDEERDELRAAIVKDQGVFEEVGDILFTAVNLARMLNVDPEDALHAAIDKFVRRFGRMEEAMTVNGQAFSDATLAEMEIVWQQVK